MYYVYFVISIPSCYFLLIISALSTKYDYAEVMRLSILFYEAQRSGNLPADNRIPYRGDSAVDDEGYNGENLEGGWYDGKT
jgi:hypothetical protein